MKLSVVCTLLLPALAGSVSRKARSKGHVSAERLYKSGTDVVPLDSFEDLLLDFEGSLSFSMSMSLSLPSIMVPVPTSAESPIDDSNLDFFPSQSPNDSNEMTPPSAEPDQFIAIPPPPVNEITTSPNRSPSIVTASPRPIGVGLRSCDSTDGFFGTVGENQTTLQFAYELETTPFDDGDLKLVVLPDLEMAITNFLLPILFEDQCSFGGRNLQTVAGSIIGISARPDDQPLDDSVCSSLIVETNQCTRFRGELTLFFAEDEGRRLQNEETTVKEALKQGMSDGEFNDAHVDIERVSYVSLDDSPDDERLNDTNGNGLLVGLVATGAGALVSLFGVLIYRRRNDKKDDKKTQDCSGDPTATVLSEPVNRTTVEAGDQPLLLAVSSSMESSTNNDYDASNPPLETKPSSPSAESIYVEQADILMA